MDNRFDPAHYVDEETHTCQVNTNLGIRRRDFAWETKSKDGIGNARRGEA